MEHLRTIKSLHDVDLKAGLGLCRYRMRSIVNIQMPAENGDGNGYFPRRVIISIELRASSAGIISMSRCCRRPLEKRG